MNNSIKKIAIFITFLCLLTTFGSSFNSQVIASTTADYCIKPHEQEFLVLINQYRASNGVSPLVQSWTLAAAAQHKSLDMAATGNYTHTLSDGTTWLDNIIKHGYPYEYRTENIAWGFNSPQNVLDAWKNSTNHNTNMLRPGFQAIGISRSYSNTGFPTWATTFGSLPDGEPPVCPTPTGPLTTPTPTQAPSDTTPPTVNITSPLNGALVAVQSSVNITANASDNVAVQKVEFFISNKRKCSDSTVPYTCLWTVGRKSNASYSIHAKAYDTSGRTTQSSTITVTTR